MTLTPVTLDINAFPEDIRPFLTAAALFDSSCSENARVILADKDGGYFVKSSRPGSLRREAEITSLYHTLGLSAEVLAYVMDGTADWLVTRKLPGEDCTSQRYLGEPKRLCDVLAQTLLALHSLDATALAVPEHTQYNLAKARENMLSGNYDKSHFPDNWGYATPEEAWAVIEKNGGNLRSDTLLHGDYCLPNVLLRDWRFSGFIDLGGGGIGDRHTDVFWGIWTLYFNLKTNAYRERFIDAYGRSLVSEDMLRLVAAYEVFL